MPKILRSVFSMSMAGIYMILFAIAIGVATFIENDYGTATAQKVIFHARWFELLLLLFGLSLVVNVFRMKLVQRKNWGTLLFHLSMIIILAGAGVTRYFGQEGMLRIREGASNNQIISSDTYLYGTISYQGKSKFWKDKVRFGSLGANRYKKQIDIAGASFEVVLDSFYPDAIQRVVPATEGGIPIWTMISAGSSGRVRHLLTSGDKTDIGELHIRVSPPSTADSTLFVWEKDGSSYLKLPAEGTVMTMATRQLDTLQKDSIYPLRLRSLYQIRGQSIVFKAFDPKAAIVPVNRSMKITSNNPSALKLHVRHGTERKEITLWGMLGAIPDKTTTQINGADIEMQYGSILQKIPFEVYLKDFQLERYPGSHSPSSYASEVEVIDEVSGQRFSRRIYMNHVLDHRGYRLFQSSFDPDEHGTILSVNHDRWGTNITYLGYFLLALGMILSLFSHRGRFHKVLHNIHHLQEKRKALSAVVVILLASGQLLSQGAFPDTLAPIPTEHASLFGKILVQDPNGRIEPLNTLSSEVVRKVAGKNGLFGQNTDQILAGMLAWPEVWQRLAIIKTGHPGINKILQIEPGEYARFVDFYTPDGAYKLANAMQTALNKPDAGRSTLDKEVIKTDERFNVLYMTFTGDMLRIFPKADDTSHRWYNPKEAQEMDFGSANVLTQNFMQYYVGRLRQAIKRGDWTEPDFALHGLINYQYKAGKDIAPSKTKRDIEILYNKINLFGWLILWYIMVGLTLLFLAFLELFKSGRVPKSLFILLSSMIVLGFLSHTIGLGVRWYLSGHAPWSNGYESMLYIGWAVLLAGLLFIKKSTVTIAATSVLAGVVLGVAGMNWLNPEITPLVPVLKSYWLSIHVSIIVASYGFFALGALLGLINLILFILRNRRNERRITLTIKELSNIAEATLTIGVIMLSIGTFLGGVWANESWGRYWGWDSKETWALVSILVYAFVLHMRMIPGFKDMYSFNLASVVAFSSILMTYFGVNYYLSGLHSYAAGDPVPVPIWVYYATAVVLILATWAYFKTADKSERHG